MENSGNTYGVKLGKLMPTNSLIWNGSHISLPARSAYRRRRHGRVALSKVSPPLPRRHKSNPRIGAAANRAGAAGIPYRRRRCERKEQRRADAGRRLRAASPDADQPVAATWFVSDWAKAVKPPLSRPAPTYSVSAELALVSTGHPA
jgi:hypothetical protein